MTEQTAFIISLMSSLTGTIILRLSGNPAYLVLSACLTGVSALLFLILSNNNKYFSLIFLGLMIFTLWVNWYCKKKRH
jgi:glucose dehydrogenase